MVSYDRRAGVVGSGDSDERELVPTGHVLARSYLGTLGASNCEKASSSQGLAN
jgi:hypothetical protein